ncbi:hypothetical protein GW626_15460 [Peribacillus muralis]|uniref:hypothetical protein n=1 Tax=Peribacillus muralis TaxID=264697 RepID=UPI001F4ED640|nr:hypothetical protein [Peribacillus muralis]MCK1991747.1 hypothetical protein [Peribacillus muralis]MCK2012305.1 hypothetical protein [Peribacillus muralis]
MNKRKLIVTSLLSLGILGYAGTETQAQEVRSFSNFLVTYAGAEKFAPESLRKSNTKGVINLSNDTGTAWITASMKNSDGVHRGGTSVQRGKRATFTTVKAQVGYKYRLGLRKTNNTGGGKVTIKGSWSASGG